MLRTAELKRGVAVHLVFIPGGRINGAGLRQAGKSAPGLPDQVSGWKPGAIESGS